MEAKKKMRASNALLCVLFVLGPVSVCTDAFGSFLGFGAQSRC